MRLRCNAPAYGGYFECAQVVRLMRKTSVMAIRPVFIATFTISLILAISGSAAIAADGDGGAAPFGSPGGGPGATGIAGSAGGDGGAEPNCFNCGGGGGGGGASGTIAGGNGGTGGGASLGGVHPVAGGLSGSGGLGVGAEGGVGGVGTNAGSAGGGGGGGGGGTAGNGGTGTVVSSSVGGAGGNGGAGGEGNAAGYGVPGGGGGGGAGGYGAIVNVDVQSNFAVTAGNGGNGGTGAAGNAYYPWGAYGGNGATGGTGLQGIVTGLRITNSATIAGGNGGSGGAGGTGILGYPGGNGGNGGLGGNGVVLTGGTLANSGSIAAGNGAVGGPAGAGGSDSNGSNGVGGIGVVGSGTTVINSGNIEGGVGGDGVTRSNAITFTGGPNILELQAGSSITGNVVAFSVADIFRLGGANDASFDVSQIGAQYLGFGIFQKTGSSIWTLAGTKVTALPWTVNMGTLIVTGAMANSTVTVNNGGTLAGIGAVGAVTINGHGIFAPGSGTPGSSMSVQSSLAMQSGAIYLVQLNPATSSFADVTGTATLGEATVNAVFANGSYVSKQYTILIAGSVSGTFGSVVETNLPANFHTTLSYDAKDAYLNLTLNYAPPAGPNFAGALNVNQQNVANTLTNFFNITGGIPMVFGTLTQAGLTQTSGEAATGTQQTTFNAMNQFMGVMMDPFASGRGDGGTAATSAPSGYQNAGPATDAYAMFTKAPPVTPFEQRGNVWAAGFGGSQTTDGNSVLGSNTSTSSVYGTAVGADYRISPFTVAGFALAGGGTNYSVAGTGSGHSDLFQAGAFIRQTLGAAYVSAALAYGWQDITTNRTVTVAGSDQLQAKFNANALSGRLEGGYRIVTPSTGGIGVAPYAAAQFTIFDLPSYAERAVGSNAFALAYGAKDVTDTRSELGIRTDKSFAMIDGVLILRSRLAWAHDFDPDRSIAATFQTLPGASFVVNGAAQASNSSLVTASVEKEWLNGWSAAATFEGEFSDVMRSYAGKGVVRYQW